MSTTKKTTDQLFRLELPRPDYPLAGRSETLTLDEWRRIYGYEHGSDILAMHGAKLVPAATEVTIPPPPPTRHAITGTEAVKLLSDIRAILWRDIAPTAYGVDLFDPDKDRTLEMLDAIADTLNDANLAPIDYAPYEDIGLLPNERILRDLRAESNHCGGAFGHLRDACPGPDGKSWLDSTFSPKGGGSYATTAEKAGHRDGSEPRCASPADSRTPVACDYMSPTYGCCQLPVGHQGCHAFDGHSSASRK